MNGIQARVSPDGLAIVRETIPKGYRYWLVDPGKSDVSPEELSLAKTHSAYRLLLDFPWENIEEEYPFDGVCRESSVRRLVCRTTDLVSGFLDPSLSIDRKDEIAEAIEGLLSGDKEVFVRVKRILCGWPDIPSRVIDDDPLWEILDKCEKFSGLLDEVIGKQFES